MTENRMKRKKTGMIWLIFTIIWMSVIFSFSAKKAVESEGMSHSVGKEIGRLIVPQFTSWSEERQEQFAKMIDFPVRKCAHATEYAVLGVLILGTAYSFSEDSGKRSMLICWCAGTAYAASDELHQLFVPGRSCQFRDVCIDSAGVLAGVLVFSLIKHKIAKYNEKKKLVKTKKKVAENVKKSRKIP